MSVVSSRACCSSSCSRIPNTWSDVAVGCSSFRVVLDRLSFHHEHDVFRDVGGQVRHALEVEGKTRSEEHTSELQSPCNLVCRLLLEKKKKNNNVELKLIHYNRNIP